MADGLNLPGTEFPEVPQIPNLAVPTQPQGQQGSTAGVGNAGQKAKVADTVLHALQGLEQGFAKAQMAKYNQMQDALMLSKTKYDQAVSQLKAYRDAGVSEHDPKYQEAVTNMAQANAEMNQRIDEMQALLSGGKAGGKANAKGTQETAGDKIGNALHKIFHAATGQPGPLAPVRPPQPSQASMPSAPTAWDPGAGTRPGTAMA